MTRGSDRTLVQHREMLSPIAVTTPDAEPAVLYRNLGRSAEIWHAVVEDGVLLGMISPGRLAMTVGESAGGAVAMAAGGELYGGIELPYQWLCCQADPQHCFDTAEAANLGVGPMDLCPRGDGTALLLHTAGQP